MKKFLNEFKDFAMKGNMIDLAIGVVIGGAFSKIVTMIVDCIITPLISLIIILLTGKADTNQLFGTITVGPFPIGQLISSYYSRCPFHYSKGNKQITVYR